VCNTDPDPDVCASATVTIFVTDNPIDAVDDDFSDLLADGSTGGVVEGGNIFDNDTLNGMALDPTDVTLTSTPTGPLTINPDGTVSVAPETIPGTYTINYTICEIANPINCDTATVTVNVIIVTIDAVDDDYSDIFIAGEDGGVLPDSNVLDNDTLNGLAVVPADVTITSTPTAPLTVNTDGTVSVAAGTTSGSYSIEYTICENENPTNCDTATVVVLVSETISSAIEVNQLVTPNNDGRNDFLFINGVENALNNSLKIFNRWGVAVYEGNNYNNQNNVFDGRSRGRSTINAEEYLPAGVYFYIFEYEKEQEIISKNGVLYISK
jgi:gliding motility-associated-like protein